MNKKFLKGIFVFLFSLAVILVMNERTVSAMQMNTNEQGLSTAQTIAINGMIGVSPIYTEGDYRYTITNDEADIIEYIGVGGDVVIPATLGGKQVTYIGANAFSECTSLTNLVIPNSIKTIGAFAFCECTSLTNLVIPNGVTTIEEGAFFACTSLINLTIPESVIEIRAYTDTTNEVGALGIFWGCTSLISVDVDDANLYYSSSNGILYNINKTILIACSPGKSGSLIIPNSVINIEMVAFYICDKLTEIILPDSVTNISLGAFARCTELTKLTIYNSTTSIGEYVFAGSEALTIYGRDPSTAKTYTLANNIPFVSIEQILVDVKTTAHEVLDTAIGTYYEGDYSSNNWAILTEFKTDGDTAIDMATDEDGVELAQTIAINGMAGVNRILLYEGDYAYKVDEGESSIVAYYGTDTDLVIPNTIGGNPVTNIAEFAFTGTSLINVTIPDGVTNISKGAFDNCVSLIKVIIPDSVTNIGESAFWRCTSLTDVVIPDSVKYIGQAAFSDCTSLVNLTIPDSVTTIGKIAFRSCTSLIHMTIPNSVTDIGEVAFIACTSLISIDVDEANQYYSSVNGILYNKNKTILIACPGGKRGNFTIPNNVVSIRAFAFIVNNNLTEITLPKSITSIEESAFALCSLLTKIIIYNSTISIGVNVFAECDALTIYGYDPSTAKTYAFNSNISFISLGLILAEEKTAAHKALVTAIGTYIEGNYSSDNWTILMEFKTHGDTAIDAATDEEHINSEQITATNGMAGVKTIIETNLLAAKAAVAALTVTDYTNLSWLTVTAAMLLPEVTKSEMIAKTIAINNGMAALVLVTQTSGGGSSTPVTSPVVQPITPQVVQPQTGMDILVNGDTVNAGIVIVTTEKNETVTTMIVDSEKLEQKLALENDKIVVTIPFVAGSDVLVSQLNGQMVKSMENKQAIIKITTDTATYTLPALQINIDAISAQLGKDVKLSDIVVTIEIAKTPAETVKIVENSAQKGQFTILAPPVEFSVKCTYDNKTIDVSKFNNYVERTVAIPTGIRKNKITTGVIIDADGTVRHVPTKIIIINGTYYAQINSLTNSTYAVIWNSITYKDVTNNPAKNAINDLGSRMVISGVKNNLFRPESDITRGEFVAMLVTSLGLAPGTLDTVYSDVKLKDWYCKYIEVANKYGIISGDAKEKFRPKDKITTQEAMTMLFKAMKITGQNVTFKKGEEKKLIASIAKAKQTQVWTDKSIATCIKAGIISIKSKQIIAPKDKITRAEAAVIIRNLLLKSKLI